MSMSRKVVSMACIFGLVFFLALQWENYGTSRWKSSSITADEAASVYGGDCVMFEYATLCTAHQWQDSCVDDAWIGIKCIGTCRFACLNIQSPDSWGDEVTPFFGSKTTKACPPATRKTCQKNPAYPNGDPCICDAPNFAQACGIYFKFWPCII